jgi:hypothetical protein
MAPPLVACPLPNRTAAARWTLAFGSLFLNQSPRETTGAPAFDGNPPAKATTVTWLDLPTQSPVSRQ